MRRTVLVFGLIAGGIMSIMMLLMIPFLDRIGFDKGEIIGYTTMVLAFLMTFFGIKAYRDNVAGGTISFGRALRVGVMITVVATLCYVVTWEVIYYKLMPDFSDRYAAYMVQKAKQSGVAQSVVDARLKEMAAFREMYKNPLVNAAWTFLEPLPVGLLLALISAVVLRRKPG